MPPLTTVRWQKKHDREIYCGFAYPTGRRESTCCHEAGHAVVAWSLGISFDRVVVVTGEQFRAGTWPTLEGSSATGYEGVVKYDFDYIPRAGLLASHQDLSLARRRMVCGVFRASSERFLAVLVAGVIAEASYMGTDVASRIRDGGQNDWLFFQRIVRSWFSGTERQGRVTQLTFDRTCALLRMAPTWRAVAAVAGAVHERGELSVRSQSVGE